MYYQLEKLEYAYADMIRQLSRGYLDQVEALFIDEQALDLPSINDDEVHKGNIPDDAVMEIINQFPAVTIEAINLQLLNGIRSETGANTTLIVEVYTQHGDDPEIANSYNHRIGSAIAWLVSEMKPSGIGLKDVGPVTLATSQTILAEGSEVYSYIKKAHIEAVLTVGAIL